MKTYAILGPRLRVFRVIESETEPHAERFEEITKEQATTIADGSGHFLIDGELHPVQEYRQTHRWNEETESWGIYVPPAPATLYPRQLWLALLKRNITEEDVAAKVATLTPEQQRIARIEMKGHVYERLSPWIGIIGAMLGLTESDMDDVFIVGSGL